MRKFLQTLQPVFFSLFGFCFLIACASTPQPTSTATLPAPIVKTVQASTTPSAVAPTLQPTLTPAPTAVRNVPLSTVGPWFAYQSKDEMIAVNVDGSGRTVIPKTQQLLSSLQLPSGYTSPDGEWKAIYLTTVPEFKFTHGIDLVLYHIPTGTSQKIASLLRPEIIKSGNTAAEENNRLISDYEVFRAMTEKGSIAWSPDGKYLAFIGAMDGSSADLYVYEIKTQKTKRLTDGPNQAATLFWSPDSKWIVHQEVLSFGTGAGASGVAAWAARADGSEVKKIATTERATEEAFIGWTPNGELLMSSESLYGYFNIRLIKVETGQVKVLQKEIASRVAYDPKSNTIAYSFTNAYEVLSDPNAGIYFASPPDAPKRQIVRCRICYVLRWNSEAGYFFAENSQSTGGWENRSVISITPTGLITVFSQEKELPSISPDGKWLLFARSPEITIYTIYGDLVYRKYKTSPYVLWRPDSKGFFFVQATDENNKEIYYVDWDGNMPSKEAVLVDKIGKDDPIYGWITK